MNTNKEGIGRRFQIPDNGSIPNSKMQGGAKRRSFLDLAVEFSLRFGPPGKSTDCLTQCVYT